MTSATRRNESADDFSSLLSGETLADSHFSTSHAVNAFAESAARWMGRTVGGHTFVVRFGAVDTARESLLRSWAGLEVATCADLPCKTAKNEGAAHPEAPNRRLTATGWRPGERATR